MSIDENRIKRINLSYVVGKYLGSSALDEVVVVDGVEISTVDFDVAHADRRSYRYSARYPGKWRVTIEVAATTWGYTVRLARPRPYTDATIEAIDAWIEAAAKRTPN